MIPCPLDKDASEATKNHLSFETPTGVESVATAHTIIDTRDKTNASASEQLRTTPPDGPYAMTVQCNDGPYDIDSFFHKETYCVRITVFISSSAIFTVVSLFSTGASSNLVNKDFVQNKWSCSMKRIRSPSLCTANSKLVSVEGTLPLFLHSQPTWAPGLENWRIWPFKCYSKRFSSIAASNEHSPPS